MSNISSFLAEILPGATAGAAISWLLRGWITERLKQSISHEYSAKLENLKNELNGKMEAVKHTYEVHQLRTSLFFDHQRSAFGEILAKVAEVNQEWWQKGYEPDVGLTTPVPSLPYSQLKALYVKHQLFLDADSIMAIELLFDIYRDSFPFHEGDEVHHRDPREPYDKAEYLQPRLAALFQQKIGVTKDVRAVRQLALLGAIRILNHYHFTELSLPVKGPLQLGPLDGAAEAVMKAEKHSQELIDKLRSFQNYLQSESGFFHEAESSLGRYLAVLDP
jgi:hypothetical protein